MPKYHEQHKGDGNMDLYGHDFACTFRVPREYVLHVPAQRLNITRLVACKNFSTAVDESRGARLGDEQWCLNACKMGNRCKFVHVSRPLSEFPSQALHAHYIWRSVNDVTYDRLWTEKDGSDVPRLTLHPCALCVNQVNMCFNMMGDGKASTEGALPPPITRPTPKTTTAASEGAPTMEEGKKAFDRVVGDAAEPEAVVPCPPVDPEVRALHDGLMLDVVVATLSAMEIPATRFLKTFGSTRALNSIRGEKEEGAATQHHLQTCYEFACENECKRGPDCDKAHVINLDPTLEVAFVRRSMRHVKAAVSSMHRGPPHGDLKPAPHVVAKLLEDEFLITKEDADLVSEAVRSDPTVYSQPAPSAVEPQPNPYRLPKAHPLRNNHLTSTIASTSKVPRGATPQYAPYPSTIFMSPNPLQTMMAGGCDFVVTQPNYYQSIASGGNHHQDTALYSPTYPSNANAHVGMCIQYPPYMLAEPVQPASAEQYQDGENDCQMARLVDDVIGPPGTQHPSQSTTLSNSNNKSSGTVGDTVMSGRVHSQHYQPQPQSWSPFNASLNWQHQQQNVPQLAHVSSTPQGSSNNPSMMQHHPQHQGYMTAPQQQQGYYSTGHGPIPTPHHPIPPQPHQQQHQAMMYSMPYPFNSGGHQLQFVGAPTEGHISSTTTQVPIPYEMAPGYYHPIPSQLGQH